MFKTSSSMNMLLIIGIVLQSAIVQAYLHSPLQTPCLKSNFTGVRCGDCEEATYTLKPTEGTGLSSVRCQKCDYFVPNGKDLINTHEFEDIGKYGCTWRSLDFFTEHPGILVAVIALFIAIISTLFYFLYHKHNHSSYRLHVNQPKKSFGGKGSSFAAAAKDSFNKTREDVQEVIQEAARKVTQDDNDAASNKRVSRKSKVPALVTDSPQYEQLPPV